MCYEPRIEELLGEAVPKKRIDDLLAPVGDDPGADYIRTRLLKRIQLELGITMRRREWETLLRCLDKVTTLGRITELHNESLARISDPTWGLEVEALLVEVHGPWRYDGRPDVLDADMTRAARHYAVSHTMDALLKECGFHMVRTPEERLDDAAWYAVPESERS